MTHMYFSARAEGRISYGHLGRTNSCYYYRVQLHDVKILTINSLSVHQQEAQLMLRNPRDRMFYVNRVSAYLVPFSR